MWDKDKAVEYLTTHASDHSLGRCAEYTRHAIEAGGVTLQRHNSAKDYGPSLIKVGFVALFESSPDSFYFHQAGDVAIVQPIKGHPHGHMCMYNGANWVSDFVQYRGVYPGPSYRKANPPFAVYRYKTIFDLPDRPTEGSMMLA